MSEIDRLCEISRVARADVEALGDLGEDRHAVLRAAYEHARDHRERELGDAVDNGLTLLPALIRSAVRRILFS
ncbi:hypothetical protein [Nocardia sp. NPDC127526]|uniref:hypothetical protein n=1 Tax=Nocardia sp. NPDC127526 TaxID=3345393 RepID=UPI00364589C7